MIGLFVVGARRLEHLRYLAHDPLVARVCGLARLPTDRTVVNWLKQFTQEALQALVTLNSELLYEQLERLNLPRLTIDVDGTVVRTGCGQSPAQLARCPALGKAAMFTPSSAIRTSATRWFTQGIVSRRWIASVNGAISASTCSLTATMASSR
jgi:hypothetical protein